jgi:hypothetical protein
LRHLVRRRARTLAQLGRLDHLDIRRQCEQRGHADVGTVEDQRLGHPAAGVNHPGFRTIS